MTNKLHIAYSRPGGVCGDPAGAVESEAGAAADGTPRGPETRLLTVDEMGPTARHS